MATDTVTLIQGEDRILKIKINNAETGDPFDLTGITEITAEFKKTDNSTLTKLFTTGGVTIVEHLLGKIEIELGDAETALLKKGTESFEVETDKSGDIKIIQFENALIVKEQLL